MRRISAAALVYVAALVPSVPARSKTTVPPGEGHQDRCAALRDALGAAMARWALWTTLLAAPFGSSAHASVTR